MRVEAFNVWNFGLIATCQRWRRAKIRVFDVLHGVSAIRLEPPLTLCHQYSAVFFADNGFQPGEVDHSVDSVIVQDLGHQRFVTDIAFNKRWMFAA